MPRHSPRERAASRGDLAAVAGPLAANRALLLRPTHAGLLGGGAFRQKSVPKTNPPTAHQSLSVGAAALRAWPPYSTQDRVPSLSRQSAGSLRPPPGPGGAAGRGPHPRRPRGLAGAPATAASDRAHLGRQTGPRAPVPRNVRTSRGQSPGLQRPPNPAPGPSAAAMTTSPRGGRRGGRRRNLGARGAGAGRQGPGCGPGGSASRCLAAAAANSRQSAFPPRPPRPLTGGGSTCQPRPCCSAGLLWGEGRASDTRRLPAPRAPPLPGPAVRLPAQQDRRQPLRQPRSRSGGSLPPARSLSRKDACLRRTLQGALCGRCRPNCPHRAFSAPGCVWVRVPARVGGRGCEDPRPAQPQPRSLGSVVLHACRRGLFVA